MILSIAKDGDLYCGRRTGHPVLESLMPFSNPSCRSQFPRAVPGPLIERRSRLLLVVIDTPEEHILLNGNTENSPG